MPSLWKSMWPKKRDPFLPEQTQFQTGADLYREDASWKQWGKDKQTPLFPNKHNQHISLMELDQAVKDICQHWGSLVQKGPHNAALSCAQPQELSQLPNCLLMRISRFVGIIQLCSVWHGDCTINKTCHSHSMMGRKRYAEQLPSSLCLIHQQF